MINLSEHALLRGSQRAISQRQMAIVVQYGTHKWHKGRKQHFMREKDIQNCLNQGIISKQESDKLHNLIVIQEANNKCIISAYRARQKKQKQILRSS